MKEKLIAILKQLGLITEENKGEVESKLNDVDLDELLSGGKEPPLPRNIDAGTKELIEKLIAQNQALAANVKTLKEALAKEAAQREAAIKAEEERQAKEAKAKIEKAVKKLLDEKKITEADKEIWTNLFEKDFEAAEKAASQLKSVSTGKTEKQTPNDDDRKTGAGNSYKVDRTALREAIAEQMENYN